MDYNKIIEDLVSREPVDEELRTAAAVSIRELLEQKMKLTSELALAKKCLEENEAAFADQRKELDHRRAFAAIVGGCIHGLRVNLERLYEEIEDTPAADKGEEEDGEDEL